MRVTDLRVDGFGVWTELHLGNLSDRITVVYGANEAGKTTLMQFMRTVLYGFSCERRQRYLPPVHGGEVGGAMDIENNLQTLAITRHLRASRSETEAEQLDLQAADGTPLPPTLLDQLLTGVDEPTFNNVFAVGLRELQELGTLDDTDAAELLYKLTTGLDRVSLVDVMQDLQRACRNLLNPEETSHSLVALQQRREQLRQQVAELTGRGHDWLELETQRGELAEQARGVQQRIDELTRSSQIVEAALQTRDLWGKRAALQRQLELLEPVPAIPPESLEKLERLGEQDNERRRQIAVLKRRRREIRQEIGLLPLNQRLWSQAARIEAMSELSPWIVSLQTQVEQLRGEVQGLEARLAHSSTPLATTDEQLPEQLPDVSRRTLSLLRGPARSLREENQKLKQTQEELEAARQQYEELSVELETALLDRGQEDLGEAVEQTGTEVSQLRRRLQLGQHLEEMQQQQQQLQGEHRELMDGQVLSLRTLAWLGVPFVAGVMLVVGGLVWSSAAKLGWPVAILGLAGWAVAVVTKISLERAAARDLEQCEKQLDLLKNQIQQTTEEIRQVDAQIPTGSGNLESRMSESEKELATLEELLPMEATLQSARQRFQAAERRHNQLTESVQDLRGQWRGALRRAQLPENLSPQAVRQLADGNEQTLQAKRQLELRREELASREQELNSLAQRVTEIAAEVDLQYSISDPQQLINHLSVAVSEQKTLYQRRKKLRLEDRKIQREGQAVVAQLRQSRTQRKAILAHAGVESEDELRHIVSVAGQRQALEDEMAEIQQQFELALGDRFPFELVEQELIDHPKEELEQRYDWLVGEAEQQQVELSSLHQQQGAIAQQSKSLVADRRLAETQLELDCVEQQLVNAVRRWRVLAVTAHSLEKVREIYETQRQPQTLIDASRYFADLTEGQYVRIWTPLTDMSLRVDMANGESLALDVLSSGTREAVFLSLRLALVADFARRGVLLPLVLDDVLVNFDQRRAQSAARVLCNFARQGHQVLMFTCHEHIVELFQSLDASLCQLPEHTDTKKRVWTVSAAELAPAASENASLDTALADEHDQDQLEDEYDDEYGDEYEYAVLDESDGEEDVHQDDETDVEDLEGADEDAEDLDDEPYEIEPEPETIYLDAFTCADDDGEEIEIAEEEDEEEFAEEDDSEYRLQDPVETTVPRQLAFLSGEHGEEAAEVPPVTEHPSHDEDDGYELAGQEQSEQEEQDDEDEIDDEWYELDVAEVPPPKEAVFAADAADLYTDWEDPQYDRELAESEQDAADAEEDESDEAEAKQRDESTDGQEKETPQDDSDNRSPPSRHQRFAWESPERWWENPNAGGAAA